MGRQNSIAKSELKYNLCEFLKSNLLQQKAQQTNLISTKVQHFSVK